MFTRGNHPSSSIRVLYSCLAVMLPGPSAELFSTLVAVLLVVIVAGAALLMLAIYPSPRHKFIVELLEKLSQGDGSESLAAPKVQITNDRRAA